MPFRFSCKLKLYELWFNELYTTLLVSLKDYPSVRIRKYNKKTYEFHGILLCSDYVIETMVARNICFVMALKGNINIPRKYSYKHSLLNVPKVIE